MLPLNLHELEAALFIELYISGLLAVLLPLGFASVAAKMAANARMSWSQWKALNDATEQQVARIVELYGQIYLPGPNRLRNLKRKLDWAREGSLHAKRRYIRFNHARGLICVREDWFADIPGIPRPKFRDLDFERTFAVTRSSRGAHHPPCSNRSPTGCLLRRKRSPVPKHCSDRAGVECLESCTLWRIYALLQRLLPDQ